MIETMLTHSITESAGEDRGSGKFRISCTATEMGKLQQSWQDSDMSLIF